MGRSIPHWAQQHKYTVEQFFAQNSVPYQLKMSQLVLAIFVEQTDTQTDKVAAIGIFTTGRKKPKRNIFDRIPMITLRTVKMFHKEKTARPCPAHITILVPIFFVTVLVKFSFTTFPTLAPRTYYTLSIKSTGVLQTVLLEQLSSSKKC